jgi:general secretion pathway protein D
VPAATTPQASPTPTTTPGLSPVPGAAPAGQAPGPETAAQIAVTTPGPELRVGGGPYIVPISVMGASRLSLVSLSVSFNAATLRVRSVQEGPFLRQGGTTTTFTHHVDASAGRVDLSMTRGADVTGASGTGLLGSLVVDAVAPGTSTLTVSGIAAMPDGRTVALTFVPANVTIK